MTIFFSLRSFIWSSRLRKPSGGTAILTLTGNRRSASRALVAPPSSSNSAEADAACCRSGLPFPQISARDFDVAVVGQLLTANLPLSEFEPGFGYRDRVLRLPTAPVAGGLVATDAESPDNALANPGIRGMGW
jgi:hypothetical protein